MIIAFFESAKYLGHLWPVALLRIFVGMCFLNAGIGKVQERFLSDPVLQQVLQKWLEMGLANHNYVEFINFWVMPNWRAVSFIVVFGEVFIGLSLILGFMVRPAILIALIFELNFIMVATPDAVLAHKFIMAVLATLFLLSAGRCVGFDYYFYKKVRGFWW